MLFLVENCVQREDYVKWTEQPKENMTKERYNC